MPGVATASVAIVYADMQQQAEVALCVAVRGIQHIHSLVCCAFD